MKATWEKIFEYCSSPVHGTLSRKIRKDVKVQINEGPVFEHARLFMGDEFVRVTEERSGETLNTYYSWDKIDSVRTYSKAE